MQISHSMQLRMHTNNIECKIQNKSRSYCDSHWPGRMTFCSTDKNIRNMVPEYQLVIQTISPTFLGMSFSVTTKSAKSVVCLDN